MSQHPSLEHLLTVDCQLQQTAFVKALIERLSERDMMRSLFLSLQPWFIDYYCFNMRATLAFGHKSNLHNTL